MQRVMAEALAAAGCAVETRDYDPRAIPLKGEHAAEACLGPDMRRLVVARLPATDPDRAGLVMFSHPDSEPAGDEPGWRNDPFALTADGGRLHGWGVADALAGCAAGVAVMAHMARSTAPRGELWFVSAPSKRHGRGMAAALSDGLRADAAVYLHPAESGRGLNEIKAMTLGQAEFRITVDGAPPNISEPSQVPFAHLGVNPLDKAVSLYADLGALAQARAEDTDFAPTADAVGRAANLHIATMTCGAAVSPTRMAGSCAISGAISFPPGQALSQAKRELEQMLKRHARDDRWLSAHPPRLEWLSGVEGAMLPDEHPLCVMADDVLRTVTGARPVRNVLHAGSDIRNPMRQADIACIGFGCLCGDLSQNGGTDEWVDAADFGAMIDAATELAGRWCAAPPPAHVAGSSMNPDAHPIETTNARGTP